MDNFKNDFDSTSIFLFFLRWWKHLFIVCFLAALAGAIFSGPRFITPKFDSVVTMFPASSTSISRAVLGGQDFLRYGNIEDAERLLQVLGSVAIRDRVRDRFDLMTHYGIKPNEKFRRSRFNQIYAENVATRRTQFGAVEVKVRDKDPVMAARLANEIAAQADSVQNEMRLARAQQAYQVARDNYDKLHRELRLAEDSLRMVMQTGIYHIEGQSSMLSRQLAIDLSAGNRQGVNVIEERLDALGEGGGAFIYLSAKIHHIAYNLTVMQTRINETRADLDNFLNFKFVIDPAIEPERKAYPVRWLIVFLAAFGAGFMGIVTIMIYENLQSKGIIPRKTPANNKTA